MRMGRMVEMLTEDGERTKRQSLIWQRETSLCLT
jgi:hypothetical protein